MNEKDFEPSNGHSHNLNPPRQESDFEESKASSNGNFIGNHPDFGDQNLGFDMGNYMNNQMMYYSQYMNPYMQFGYPYMGPGYTRGNFMDKKGHFGKKRYHGHGGSQTQIIYAKKAKPLTEDERNKLESDLEKLTLADTKTTNNENTESSIQKLPHKLEKAGFYVIKSYSEEDVFKAIKHNLWCSTKEGNVKLHNAFVTANSEYPIYLLFSVNSSGHFVGVAQMKSPVDFDKNFPGWGQSHKWKGSFKISWVYIKDVPNRELRHLKNEYNEGKPVPNSRDCQEVPSDVGVKCLEIFENYKNQTSILDDYDFYEMQEKNQGHS